MTRMPQPPYLAAPVSSPDMPAGIPYIVANEAAERFSFYGMRAILVVFMMHHLKDAFGHDAPMNEQDAKGYYHLFVAATYITPLVGAMISDIGLGKYKTILGFSVFYCLGHLALALDDTRLGLLLGLSLIAVGAGGIKPCVSAHVGDQFGDTNKHLLEKVFGWFYFSINFGATFSTMLTPWLLKELPAYLQQNFPQWSAGRGGWVQHVGPHMAFGVPGLLMILATAVFWMGRRRFVHIPPRGWAAARASVVGEGGRALLKLTPVLLCVSVFWSMFDQSGSSWVQQAEKMNRTVWGYTVEPAALQAINPILVLAFIPLFAYVVYPAVNRWFVLTPLRKVGIGFLLTAASFGVCAWVEVLLKAGATPFIGWQLLAYVFMTAAEIMVSITCLEFSYTQAPHEMKSFIMAIYLASVSLGNFFASFVNFAIKTPTGAPRLEGPSYFLFFVLLMLATTLVFVLIARRYREKSYIQAEQPAPPDLPPGAGGPVITQVVP